LESFEKSKEKLVRRIETCKQTLYYENIRHQVERRTENHRHSRRERHLLRYWDDAAWMKNWLLYSNRVMQSGTVDKVLK